jgi:prepilin-type N-terminal cleavage/methylation domain-containing protein
MMMRTTRGFTLIEMLVSMSIFAVVAFLTMTVVTQALQYNARQQATVAAQSKLRRVIEVIGQEVRGSVFGGVSHAPYNSNNGQLSLYLLEQGSGYTVATEPSFETLSYFKILTETQPVFDEVILVDSEKTNVKDPTATLFPISTIVSSGVDTWRLNHPSCINGIFHNRYLQAFGVNSVGFRLDNASKTLMLNEDGIETPMAFGITQFKVEYLYTKQSGGTERRSTPFLDPNTNLPAKIYKTTAPVEVYILSELQITVSTEEIGKGKVTRTYTGQVPLLISSNNDFKSMNGGSKTATKENIFDFEGVRLCN